jgi:hypothetical protein
MSAPARTSRKLIVAVVGAVALVLISVLVLVNPPNSGVVTFPSGGTYTYPVTSAQAAVAEASSVNCDVAQYTGGPGTVGVTERAITPDNSTYTTIIYPSTSISQYSGVWTTCSYTSTTTENHTVGYISVVTEIESPGNWRVVTCTYMP